MPRLSKIGAACLAAFGWTTGGSAAVTASYLVVAGGGGGGYSYGGGGGAGGLLASTTSLNPTLSYTITVGAGGAGATTTTNGANGSNSSLGSVSTATGGGGGGGNTTNNGSAGGSGGGGAGGGTTSGGAGTSGQGYAGGGAVFGGAGGGGGAGAVGATGTGSGYGDGGVGLQSSITGLAVYYAGGGGGYGTGVYGVGGNGGGGGAGVNGTANTGGGGGGFTGSATFPAGGSGIVIISYAGAQQFGGGVVTSSGGNTIHTFLTSGTLAPLNSLSASYLIVAGGGGGGGVMGGGAGAGGFLSGSGVTIDTNSTYLVTVGSGGAGGSSGTYTGSQGVNSTFSMVSTAAVGGGGGGGANAVGLTGGSGGGGGYAAAGGAGTSGQGYAGGYGLGATGYPGGGGGGAGAAGQNAPNTGQAGNGGVGLTSSISGTSTYYAGGGGGGGRNTSPGSSPGTGGSGGGGNGSAAGGATAGTANTGGGGGGGGYDGASYPGAAGGSGIVVISYAGATQLMAGGTVTITGGNVIHTFTSSGYLAPLKYVGNSLRFRSSASAYLNRVITTTSNQKTFTWSGWVKRGILNASNLYTLYANGSATPDYIGFYQDSIRISFNGGGNAVQTTAVYRDPAAWYHVVVAYDTTQATDTNRVKVYVNGTQVTSFSTAGYPAQNYNTGFNTSGTGMLVGQVSSGYFYDGYISELNWIDGQALTPNSFGTFNSYGVWQPITYGGSYGTNGFYLPFTNKTSTTTLGYDFSPAGNNWTPNNISLTTGSTYDSMTDVPTLTSATAANYCVLSPLDYASTSYGSYLNPPTNGNLTQSNTTGSAWGINRSTIGITGGKWYVEVVQTGSNLFAGVINQTQPLTFGSYGGSDGQYAFFNNGGGTTGYSYTNGTSGSVFTIASGDVIGLAYDYDAQTLGIYRNNSLQATVTGIPKTAPMFFCATFAQTTASTSWNFGQQPWTYTPPTGYIALNTYNI